MEASAIESQCRASLKIPRRQPRTQNRLLDGVMMNGEDFSAFRQFLNDLSSFSHLAKTPYHETRLMMFDRAIGCFDKSSFNEESFGGYMAKFLGIPVSHEVIRFYVRRARAWRES